jgi:CRP/FNR family cyclic AMP-dependent transcriptional regulator
VPTACPDHDEHPSEPTGFDALHRVGYERDMPTAFESFSKIPLFANLSSRQLRKVLKSANEDRYEEGDVIVTEGGRTQTLFVILEGTAKVVRNGGIVARRSAGEFFGEISMIDLRRRMASVIAETPMRCLVLYHEDFRKLVTSDPQVAWSLIQTLAGRLREDWEKPTRRQPAEKG